MRVHLYFTSLYGRIAYQFLLSVLLLILLSFQTQSFADINGQDSISIYHKAPIIIDGYKLFSVRGFSSFTAEERASVIKKRIEEIAADPTIPANSIQIIQNESSDDLYTRGKFILSVFDIEAQSEGITRDILSFGIKNRITKAIYNYRYERKPETLLTRTFYAIGQPF